MKKITLAAMAIVISACATTEFAGGNGGYMVAGVGQLLFLIAGLHTYFSRYSVNSRPAIGGLAEQQS